MHNMNMKDVRLVVLLEQQMYDEAKTVADEEGVSLGALVRDALKTYLAQRRRRFVDTLGESHISKARAADPEQEEEARLEAILNRLLEKRKKAKE